MSYKICVSCGLKLPDSVMNSIIVKSRGKLLRVNICEVCEKIKKKETKQKETK